MALIYFQHKIGAAKMLCHFLPVMRCGVRIEVAGTEHVTAARFDVRSCNVEVWVRRLFLL
jgi:ABC-type dipeptide/oligopeptide/nickel transport system ATPase component